MNTVLPVYTDDRHSDGTRRSGLWRPAEGPDGSGGQISTKAEWLEAHRDLPGQRPQDDHQTQGTGGEGPAVSDQVLWLLVGHLFTGRQPVGSIPLCDEGL